MELKITDQNFDTEVRNSSVPVMVDFYADWCNPCKMMSPLVAQLANEYSGKCRIGKCNIDENPKAQAEFKIMSVPTFLFLQDGKVTDKMVGSVSKSELEEKIRQMLA